MKIYLLLLIYLSFTYLVHAQNVVRVYDFNVKSGHASDVARNFADYHDVERKSGAAILQSVSFLDGVTHRMIFAGDPANWGRSDSLSNEDKWAVFSHKLNNHIEKWTHSSSGNVISWVGDNDDYKYAQIYEFKASDPSAFKAAHDMLVNEMSPTLKGEIGFGSYEIGGYKGASHWVVVTAKNWQEMFEPWRGRMFQ